MENKFSVNTARNQFRKDETHRKISRPYYWTPMLIFHMLINVPYKIYFILTGDLSITLTVTLPNMSDDLNRSLESYQIYELYHLPMMYCYKSDEGHI
jgi:hypothetical protein